MIDFLVNNMQTIMLGGVVFGTFITLLFGFRIVDAEAEIRRRRYDKKYGKRTLLVGGAAFILVSTIGLIPAGHRGVVFDRGSGILPAERNEGIILVIPFWQTYTAVKVRTQVFEYQSFVQTKDLQEVTLPIAVNYHVDPQAAAQLYQEVGLEYAQTIIEPAVFQAATQAAGLVVAEDIAQSRAALAVSIADIVSERLSPHGIIIETVSIKDAIFDSLFITAIKNKVIAEQKAAESLRLVEVAKNEARQVAERAAGDAQALALMGEGQEQAIASIAKALGFTSEEYLLWLRLNKWTGVLPSTILGSGQDVIVSVP